jgi:putative nucleotidyltransferase with HDIG domain
MLAGSRDRLRLAELIGALSLATDLGMGQPMAHALRTCLLALALGRTLDLSEHELADTYYVTLLRFVGCTGDSHELLEFAAGDDVGLWQVLAGVANGAPDEVAAHLVRFMKQARVTGDIDARVREALTSRDGMARRSITAHCEVASMLAARLGLGASVCDALRHAFERWDGHGFPDGRSREDVPPAARVALVARDIEVITRARGVDAAQDALRQRRGAAYDPRAVDAFLRDGVHMMADVESCDPWEEVLRREPRAIWLSAGRIDEALTAFADFADIKTPFTLGHSRGVAQLSESAARHLGFADDDVTRVRRAALLHDIGRSGIPNAIWERPGPLSMEQWERVRLHAYYTERVLGCCDFLRPIGRLAGAHHERLDGSGYHRESRGTDLDRLARLLAAADACQAMMQARPYRQAYTLDETARILRAEVAHGRLDGQAVEAVLTAAGAPALRRAPRAWPGDLTGREVEVLRLMAQGRSNKEMSSALGITPKTVGHHVQHIYDKLGFSTRAAAALFAVEHGLL